MAAQTGLDVQVDTSRALRNVKAGLRSASPEFKREFYKALNRATKPLKAAALTSLSQYLPRRGGMAVRGAKTTLSTSSAGGTVSIRSKRGGSWEAGRLRHPVFGNRAVWVAQPIRPGWFSEPIAEEAPAVRAELVEAIDHAVQAIAKRTAT